MTEKDRIEQALKAARELDCMILNGARSKRAYDKMGRLSERVVGLLENAADQPTPEDRR